MGGITPFLPLLFFFSLCLQPHILAYAPHAATTPRHLRHVNAHHPFAATTAPPPPARLHTVTAASAPLTSSSYRRLYTTTSNRILPTFTGCAGAWRKQRRASARFSLARHTRALRTLHAYRHNVPARSTANQASMTIRWRNLEEQRRSGGEQRRALGRHVASSLFRCYILSMLSCAACVLTIATISLLRAAC